MIYVGNGQRFTSELARLFPSWGKTEIPFQSPLDLPVIEVQWSFIYVDVMLNINKYLKTFEKCFSSCSALKLTNKDVKHVK